MIREANAANKTLGMARRHSITKYLDAKYGKTLGKNFKPTIRIMLRKLAQENKLVQVKRVWLRVLRLWTRGVPLRNPFDTVVLFTALFVCRLNPTPPEAPSLRVQYTTFSCSLTRHFG